MAHALGLGTLWATQKCGLNCDESNLNNVYECYGANHEYSMLRNNTNKILGISSEDCAHWSGEFIDNIKFLKWYGRNI